MPIICDTNILLFDALQPNRLSNKAQAALELGEQQRSLCCSDISLWEIAMLLARKRIVVAMETTEFLKTVLAARRLQVMPISPKIATLSQADFFQHGDPADRLIAATAIHHRASLITSDKKLLDLPKIKTIW